MRKLMFVTALGCLPLAGLTGCSKADNAEAKGGAKEELATMTVDQVDAEVTAKTLQAVDCNHDGLRKKMGVVPGAILVSDVDKFDAKELPADKTAKLVFYCADPG
jgi:hypothetical protein